MGEITSAGRLLHELRSVQGKFKNGMILGASLKEHYQNKSGVHWVNCVVRLEGLINQVSSDVGVLPDVRRSRYLDTIDRGPRVLVDFNRFGSDSLATSKVAITELVLERLENLHDHLVTAGRTLRLEKIRSDEVQAAIHGLIQDIEGGEATEIDGAVIEHLKRLLYALERYELFGPEGVRDYVSELVGSILTRSMEVSGTSSLIRERVSKVVGVAKAVLDGYVYLATGVQMLDWGGEKVANILS